MVRKPGSFDTVLGLAIVGGLVTGGAGLIAALIAFVNDDMAVLGVCLGAAALARGLVANAVLRQ